MNRIGASKSKRVRDFFRLRIQIWKNSSFVRDLRSSWLFVKSLLQGSEAVQLRNLTEAFTYANFPGLLGAIGRELDRVVERSEHDQPFRTCEVARSRYRVLLESDAQVTRSLILKPPVSDRERGVFFSVFEYNWLRILDGVDDEFFQNYDMVLASSWSPTDYGVLAEVLDRTDREIFVQACNHAEKEKLRIFNERLVPVDSLPSDWLNPDLYSPKPHDQREIDLIVVSSWAPFKRHWHLMKVLSEMPCEIRVACVGLPDGNHSMERIKDLAREYGVLEWIEFFERIPIDEVSRLQCNSKCAAVFSLREGCCVAGTEALMADTPLAMLADAFVGSADYIVGGVTGVRLEPGREAAQLANVIRNSGSFRAREWAMENVSYRVTTSGLNDLIKGRVEDKGGIWTQDLSPHGWRPFPTFFDEAEKKRIRLHAENLVRRYPEVFPRDWADFVPK